MILISEVELTGEVSLPFSVRHIKAPLMRNCNWLVPEQLSTVWDFFLKESETINRSGHQSATGPKTVHRATI